MKRLFIISLLLVFCVPACTLEPVQPAAGLIVESHGCNFLPLVPFSADDSTARYRLFSEDCLCNSEPILVCSHPGCWNVSVSGTAVKPLEGLHLSGPDDQCHSLSGIIGEGDNFVEFKGCGQPGMLYLAGDFAALPADGQEWYAAPPAPLSFGDLTQQGLPFFQGYVSYSRQYLVPERVGRRTLRIGRWEGSRCEVYVNGAKVVTRRVDSYLQPGTNYVEVRVFGHPLPPAPDTSPRAFGLFEEFTLQ